MRNVLHQQVNVNITDMISVAIDREFVTSVKKSRILTNFPKLKKFVKIRTKIR